MELAVFDDIDIAVLEAAAMGQIDLNPADSPADPDPTVIDFQRNKTRLISTGNCVAALKEKKTMEIGFCHFGHHTTHGIAGATSSGPPTDVYYLKTFSTDVPEGEGWKFENCKEKPGNIYTLDQKFALHDKVNIFENKAEPGSAEEKKCTPKGGRIGTIVDVKQAADVRLLGNSQQIVRNVDLANAEQYRSVNSYWMSMGVVLDERKGNVLDAIYKVYVRDDEDRRLIITASACMNGKNGALIKIAGVDKFSRAAVAPGDRVTILSKGVRRFPRGSQTAIRTGVPVGSVSVAGVVGQLVIGGPPTKKAKMGAQASSSKEKVFSVDEKYLEWVDAKPETPITAETQFTVEKVELDRLEVSFSSIPFTGDMEEGPAVFKEILLNFTSKALENLKETSLEVHVKELIEIIEKLGEEKSPTEDAVPIPQFPYIYEDSIVHIMDSISVAMPSGSNMMLPASIPFTMSPAEPIPSTSNVEAVDLPVKAARDALNAMTNLSSIASKLIIDARKNKIQHDDLGNLVAKASRLQRKISTAIQKNAKAQGDMVALNSIFERDPATPVAKEDLDKVILLVSNLQSRIAEGGDRLNISLNGKYEVATPEVYGNLLFDELRSAFVSDQFPAEPLKTELQSQVFENERQIAEVIRLYTTYDIRWMDGSVSKDVPSFTLNRARRVGHFTETQICPGLFAARSAAGPKNKKAHSPTMDEFGLITTVIEEERIMTVRWFKKNGTAPDYTFVGEDTFPIFEFIPHDVRRYSIGSLLRFVPQERRGRPLRDLICEVISNSDDGYQVVRFLDGEEAKLWPGQGEALAGGHDYTLEYILDSPSSSDFNAEFADYEEDGAELNSFYEDDAFDYDFDEEEDIDDYMDDYSPTDTHPAVLDYLPLSYQPATASFTTEAEAIEKMRALRLFRHTACKGECVTLLDKATPGKRLDTHERAVSFIALNLCTYPNAACTYKAPKFNTADEFLASEKFKDAREFVSQLYSFNESEELKALKEKYPEWEHQLYDLHSTNEAGISKLAEINVKHMAFPSHKNENDSSASSFIGSMASNYKHTTIYAMPFPHDAELKQKADNILAARRKARGVPFGSSVRKEQLSFLMKNPFEGIRFSKPECSIYVSLSAGSHVELLKSQLKDDSITICSQLDAEVLNTIMMAQHMVTGVDDVREETEAADARFEDDETWDNVILQIDSMSMDGYGYGGHNENELTKKMRFMAFDFPKIFDALGLSHDDITGTSPRANTKDFKESSMLAGSALSAEVIPLTYKIDVASDCVSSEISDSFLLFHVMSQIITSDNWPTLTIEIHKNLFTDSSLDQNFVKSLICLRQAGILSGPFFDIAEAKEMSMLLTKQYISGKGEWVEKLGLEVMKELCPMLRKTGSMSTIRMWKRLNAAEEFFPLQKLITIIRRIIDGPSDSQCEEHKIVPLQSAEGLLESIYEEKLRDEIQHWIRSASTTPPAVVTTGGTFEILDSVGTGHYFLKKKVIARSPKFTAKLRKEHKLLGTELPEGIDVVCYADRTDLFRAVIIGPKDTPYEGFPFVFDIYLPDMYPSIPPKVHFHSFSKKGINPNLYVDGKVCVSLLGTWKADTNSELWDPVKSNLLQVLMSIYTIILMTNEPYYNEPGFELRREIPEVQAESKNYNGTVISGCLEGLSLMLRSSMPDIATILDRHYATTITCLLERMHSWIRTENPVQPSFPIVIDKGMARFISNYVEKIAKQLEKRALGETEDEEGMRGVEDDGVEVSVEMEFGSPVKETPDEKEEVQKMETSPSDECRTMFSEGDPHYDCPSFKSFIVMRQD